MKEERASNSHSAHAANPDFISPTLLLWTRSITQHKVGVGEKQKMLLQAKSQWWGEHKTHYYNAKVVKGTLDMLLQGLERGKNIRHIITKQKLGKT